MNVLDAAYLTAHDYPGGARALGYRMGKRNLSDEVNPHIPTAKLGLADATTMQALACDYRVLYAMATDLGHFPPLPLPMPVDGGGDLAPLGSLSELAGEFGRLVQEVTHTLADGQVSDNELHEVTAVYGHLIVRGQQLMAKLSELNAALRARATPPGVL